MLLLILFVKKYFKGTNLLDVLHNYKKLEVNSEDLLTFNSVFGPI